MRNILDEGFFRAVLNKNLVPALREVFAQDDDRSIVRFLRDSALVKWLVQASETGVETRIRVNNYMSKMRTEVYFESREGKADWKTFRGHWQFMMGELPVAFPFLTFKPTRKAVLTRWSEDVGGIDDEMQEVRHERVTLVETDEEDWWDDEEFDYECILSIGGDDYSYGEMFGGELIEHMIGIELNEVGSRWAANLKVLEAAEVISVDLHPHMISVAPWHARDV
jgi:hypothetical protein